MFLHQVSTSLNREIMVGNPTVCSNEITRSETEASPSHYTLKIEQFSQLSELLRKTKLERYESADFEAGSCKWRLCIYPNGDDKRNGDGHISLYLLLSENNNELPLGWELKVAIQFFVYDHNRDKYLNIQDGKIWRLHAMRRECGISQVLSVDTFNDSSNGYLVNDGCVFGAELLVMKRQGGKVERLSIVRNPDDGTFTWNVKNFFGSNLERHTSEIFDVKGCKWKLQIYSKGDSRAKGEYISLFLLLEDFESLPSGSKVYAEYSVCIKSRVSTDRERQDDHWFTGSSVGWGWPKFMSLSDLKSTDKGFIIDDTVTIEVKFTCVSVVRNLEQI